MAVTYLYGFVPAGTALPDGGLLGVADTDVELIPADGFAAVTSRVPDTEFGAAALERSALDVEWMAAQGLRHEQVIAWFVDHSTILPSRLLTLFTSDGALADAVAGDGAEIRDALARFRGLREWDLKVGYDAARFEEHLGEVSAEIGRLDREIEQASPGKGFLLRKKRKELARSESRAAARGIAHDLLTALEAHADDVVRLALTAEDTPVVLNAALLIRREWEDAALGLASREAERLAGVGVEVRYSGPWAPYRFVEAGGG